MRLSLGFRSTNKQKHYKFDQQCSKCEMSMCLSTHSYKPNVVRSLKSGWDIVNKFKPCLNFATRQLVLQIWVYSRNILSNIPASKTLDILIVLLFLGIFPRILYIPQIVIFFFPVTWNISYSNIVKSILLKHNVGIFNIL